METHRALFGEILPVLILQEVFITGREKDMVIRIQQTEINLADILPVCQAFLQKSVVFSLGQSFLLGYESAYSNPANCLIEVIRQSILYYNIKPGENSPGLLKIPEN